MKNLAAAAILLSLLAGCVGWKPAGGDYHADGQRIQLRVPEKWMARAAGNTVLFTRDGLMLQRIAVTRTPLAEKKQFVFTKKRVTEGMLPKEVAEVIADDLLSTTGVLNMAVEENVPATVAGQQGCRITYSFRMQDGPSYRGIVYGFIHDAALYEMLYVAPQRYYFDLDREKFGEAAASLRLVEKP